MPSKIIFLILTALALAIGYYGHVEYPEECDFPIGIRIFYSLARVITHLSEVFESIGGSYVYLFRLIEIDTSPKMEDLEIFVEDFNGVPTTIFKPTGASDAILKPAIIFYHGGGWAVGSVALYAAFIKTLAKKSGMTIVFPEYRLAPENPYPVPLQDCVKATLGFMEQADKFGVDKKKIMFVGDSAGGNLATAVSLRLARMKDNNMKPCYMTVIYPVLQISDFRLPSYQQNPSAPLVYPNQVVRFALHYMGLQNETGLIQPMLYNYHMKEMKSHNFAGEINEKWVPESFKRKTNKLDKYTPTTQEFTALRKYKNKLQAYASDIEFAPLSATDEEIRLLPRTHIVTSEHDVLRDESIILYQRMKKLGMDVTYVNLMFAPHGVWNMYGAFRYDKLENAANDFITKLKDAAGQC